MVKTYLRYSLDKSFGIIASPNSEAQFDHSGRLVVSGALESLIVWNPKLGTKVFDKFTSLSCSDSSLLY